MASTLEDTYYINYIGRGQRGLYTSAMSQVEMQKNHLDLAK